MALGNGTIRPDGDLKKLMYVTLAILVLSILMNTCSSSRINSRIGLLEKTVRVGDSSNVSNFNKVIEGVYSRIDMTTELLNANIENLALKKDGTKTSTYIVVPSQAPVK